ncbi:MAG TPA: hypothetical protein VHY08_04655 [Bacillota bacterium]|nr:hypothetical protein [Bacillota bacterium]
MKPQRILIVIILVIIIIGTVGCGTNTGPKETGVIPTGGYWASENFGVTQTGIAFYISPDGKNITSSGSPMDDGLHHPSLYFKCVERKFGTILTLPIVEGKFTFDVGIYVVTGTFSDARHCSGTAVINETNVHKTVNWTASPHTYSPVPLAITR